ENDPTSTRARKPRKKTPIEPWVKACTEPMMPERVRKVPKRVRPKVRMMRERFQSFSMRRRSWIITEWRKAVAVSQGMKAEFSTGRPRRVAAPADQVIAPPTADEQAQGEEVPGDDRPAPRDGDPLLAGTAHQEGGHGEGVGHGEAREAQIERHGVRDHPRILEERVEAAPVRRDGLEALEGRSGHRHDEQEEGEDAQHHREDPGVELGLATPVLDDHDEGVDGQHPRPEDDRALEGAPQRGYAVVEGRAPIRIEGDVADGAAER